MPDNLANIPTEKEIKVLRRYLKVKIQEDNVTYRNYEEPRHNVYDLIKRTVLHGESHSALVIGPRGCGKTALINSVLSQLSKEADLVNDAIIVKLNGLIHHDEKVALKAITAQMQLENAVDGKVFGTFAEQLSFLLSCLTSGVDRRCRSMVFLLDECDMFCRSSKPQTLLYNLFDITHSQQAPMCVLGITNRIDFMELLEKRVKSRFSHRHITLFPHEGRQGSPLQCCLDLFVQLLSLPKPEVKKKGRKKSVAPEDMETNQEISPVPEIILAKCKIDPKDLSKLSPDFIEDWNAHIKALVSNENVVDAIEKMCYYTYNEQIYRNFLFQIVSKLSPTKAYIDPTDIVNIVDSGLCPERRVKQLQSLSTLELSLIVAMWHGTQLLDDQPLNFEMVLHRYQKFATSNSSTQSVPRAVVLKAFEHLQELELIVPAKGQSAACMGEHRLYALAACAQDIRAAVSTARHLPTEILHWLDHDV